MEGYGTSPLFEIVDAVCRSDKVSGMRFGLTHLWEEMMYPPEANHVTIGSSAGESKDCAE